MITVEQPPIEAEVRAEAEGFENDMLETGLANYVRKAWSRAKITKVETTERLLKCERQRRGEYDPDRAREIAETGGSDIFMMLTDIKARAAESWIKDVMLGYQDKPFELDPSQEPQVPPEMQAGIIDFVKMEAESFLQQYGSEIHPETFRARMEEVHEEIMNRFREEAKDSARRMEDKIADQLKAGHFNKAIREFINDFVTYPTAILKGPTVRRHKEMKWGPQNQPIVFDTFNREIERVAPFDIYPSPLSTGVDDGYLFQRHRLSRKDLNAMIGCPGYDDEAIKRAIDMYGQTGHREFQSGDRERELLEGKPMGTPFYTDLIETLEFWGSIQGSMLKEWGMDDVDDEYKEYEVNLWMVGSEVIKCVLNPDPLGRRPYDIASFEEIPGAFWGLALPEIMRDIQVMCNAAARSLANNMGIASGPQVEVQVDRLPDGEDVTSMYPWKLWQTTSDRTGGGQPAVRFFQPSMNSGELLNVYMTFAKQADEVTGIPNYIYGGGVSSGAGRTSSGLSMLMDNAAKGIKQAITNIDKVIGGVVGRFYIHNMMFDPDPYIKGDFKVQPKGATGLIAKEQMNVRRNEFLQITANPVDLQIVGAEGRAYLLRELARGLNMDVDKIVPSPERLKEIQDMQQAQQMEAMMAGGGNMAPQPEAPVALDPAGNPAGGPQNLVQ